MTDEPHWTAHDYRIPQRQPTPGELLFEFVRVSDQAPMSCELRFHGESFGWEAQFLERGELFFSRGAFVTSAAAVRWAEEMRRATLHPVPEPGSILLATGAAAAYGRRRHHRRKET